MPPREELSSLLRQLRTAADLTLDQAAERLEVTKTTVWRWEKGRTIPPPDQAYTAAERYGARMGDRRRARDLAKEMQTGYRRTVLTRNQATRVQLEIGEREAKTRLIRTFSPLLIPGLLQTEAYMRVVFGSGLDEEKVAEAVAARQQRQALLRSTGHQFTQVLTYGALTWCAGDHETMTNQLEHIIEVSRLPSVRVGVIPARTPARTFPLHAVDVYDINAAMFGTVTVTAVLENPDDVTAAVAMFEKAEALAVFGDEARAILVEEAGRYSNTSSSRLEE